MRSNSNRSQHNSGDFVKPSFAEMRSGSFSIESRYFSAEGSSKRIAHAGGDDSVSRLSSGYAPKSFSPLMKPCRGFWVEVGRDGLTPQVLLAEKNFPIDDAADDILWYSDYFAGREHANFVGLEPNGDPFVVSVMRQTNPSNSHSKLLRVLLRHKKGDDRQVIQESMLKTSSKLFAKSKPSSVPINDILRTISPELASTCSKLRQVKDTAIIRDLVDFEKKQQVKRYKFGVLLCKEGQTKEEEMFSNEFGSEMYEQFLETLGETVPLKGWDKYKGGLDNEHESTGSHSIYTTWHDNEIMFHVSTMLPFSTDNPQQLERKRHLGNDIVVLVFKEGNTPYIPNTISSDFIHVIGIVQPEIQDDKVMYRLSVASKDGVPPFSPSLPVSGLFERGPAFRNLVLSKLINGERAAYKSAAFSGKLQRTRAILLKEIENRYTYKS